MKPTLIEFDEYISPDGETYKFRDGIQKFVLSGTNGLGLPRINYRTQRGPFQNGQTVLGFTLEPRILTLIHRRNGCSRQEYWDMRADILNILRPNRQSLTSFSTGVLRKKLPDNSKRDLNVLVSNGLQFQDDPGIWDEFSLQDSVQFTAFDPVFFGPEAETITFLLTTIDELVFQFAFDPTSLTRPMLLFGGDLLYGTTSVTYTGTWETFPTIAITGPLTNPIIRNLSTDKKIELDYNVSAGEVVTVSLGFGNKTVTNNSGTNLIGTITSDSDLSTFSIVPTPTVAGGVNTIVVGGANAVVGVTSIEISYYIRYIGI